MNSIPEDLFFEIFSRLPSKSIARFRCVSKLWESMLHRPYFTEFFLTRSSARPRLLFAFRRVSEKRVDYLRFVSLPQPHNPYETLSSTVVAADLHMTFPMPGYIDGYASGLVLITNDQDHVICNPNTGQYSILPKVIEQYMCSVSFLGFDPIDKQFKVLLANEGEFRILTLGTGEVSWRKVQCSLPYCTSCSEWICINGVVYCLVKKLDETLEIFCFDVRSEKSKIIDVENFYFCRSRLVNYKGKLGVIHRYRDKNILELHTCVLEDVEKHEWSKHVYTFPHDCEIAHHLDDCYRDVSVVGVTATGEIVLSPGYTYHKDSPKSYMFYFNPESKSLQKVQIPGSDGFSGRDFDVFVDHVEDLNLNDAKILKSSIFE
ncbi:unnamed protein product [Microthlaspi erraticum]|uniref:F-box domain-containing protein n=1 Tax=Microthlaspi erraticum TaxID=1685480 RepID=A0A6D2IYN6_9BRAS|nr:unnamed protein product [Microthlaspi erraticum]